eukprot:7220854-Alexandrium_andersonii.AAC.1
MNDMYVEAAPFRARGATREEVWPLSAQQTDDMLTVFSPVKVPGLHAGAGAKVEGPGREDAQAR